MTKKKQPTMEIKPINGQITSEKTLGINDPEIVEAEVINEEVGEDVITYVSIINELGPDEFQFEEITDPIELQKVEEEIEKEIKLLTEE